MEKQVNGVTMFVFAAQGASVASSPPLGGGVTNLLEKGAQLLRSAGPRWCTDARSLETGFNSCLRPARPLRRLQKTHHHRSHLHSCY